MTVSTTTSAVAYTGTNTTATYVYTWEIAQESDLIVWQGDGTGNYTELTLNTDYTVTGVAFPTGGTITLLAGNLAVGNTVFIGSDPLQIQALLLQQGAPMNPADIMNALDLLTREVQANRRLIDDSLQFPVAESLDGRTNVFPGAPLRANQLAGFDSSGNVTVYDLTVPTSNIPAQGLDQIIDTVAALKALAKPSVALTYLVRGYYAAGDGGGGQYYWSSSSAVTDNGGTVIAANAGGIGRWIRLQAKLEAVNVRWFGATGDGVSDDTNAVANAQGWAITSGANAVNWPPGDYRCNVVLTAKINQVGAGNQKTYVSSFTNNGWAFTLNDRDTGWFFATISDMFIGRDAFLQNGVRFGGDTYVANDELTGRWIFDHINFGNDVSIYKQSGNIGNRFISCQFRSQIYAYYAFKRAGGSIMHSGADTFYSCHFQEAAKAAVFINSAIDGSSNTEFFQCIFEANPGFAIFIRNYTGSFAPGVRIDSMFCENNATGGTIAINDGATGLAGGTTNYTAQDVYLRNNHQFLVMDTTITKWQLVDSIVRAVNCSTSDGLDTITKDATSIFLFENLTTDSTTSNGFFCEDVVNAVKIASNSATHFITKPRHTISERWAGNIIFSKTFQETIPETIDTIPFTHVMDGTVYAACGEGTAPDAVRHNIPNSNYTIPTNKYIVWTMDIKLISGTITELALYGANVLSANFGFDGLNALTAGRWYTMGGFCNTVGVTAFACTGQFTFSNGAVFRLGGYQILAFDNPQDAMEFQRSGIFTPPATTPREWTAAAIPITGTHLRGDRVWYTSPSTGNPPGAVCTVAGTPGTWKAMADLA